MHPQVESASQILSLAKTANVAFCVVGDALCATTHTDLILRCRQNKPHPIDTTVVHNASVMNAVGACGLQVYRFGETVSIPFFSKTWRPLSFYDKVLENRARGLHTLCLLDIKVKEISDANRMRYPGVVGDRAEAMGLYEKVGVRCGEGFGGDGEGCGAGMGGDGGS